MSDRSWRILGGVAIFIAIILHNEEWLFASRGQPLFNASAALFGWLPADIVYHLVWIGFGTLAGWLLLRGSWRARD